MVAGYGDENRHRADRIDDGEEEHEYRYEVDHLLLPTTYHGKGITGVI